MRKSVYGEGVMGKAGSINDYADDLSLSSSNSADWILNNTFLNIIDSAIRSKIAGVNIQYTPAGDEYTSVTTINRKVFLLSATELGITNGSFNVEGQKIDYFNSDARRAVPERSVYWTRTRYKYNRTQAIYIMPDGDYMIAGNSANTKYPLRPAFTLPSSIPVNESTGEVIG